MSSLQLVSMTRAAEILDCSRPHVYNLAAAGHFKRGLVEIKASGTRTKTRLYLADVEAFIKAQTRIPQAS